MPVVSIRQWPDIDPVAVPSQPISPRKLAAVQAAAVSLNAETARKTTATVTISPLLASQLLMLQQ